MNVPERNLVSTNPCDERKTQKLSCFEAHLFHWGRKAYRTLNSITSGYPVCFPAKGLAHIRGELFLGMFSKTIKTRIRHFWNSMLNEASFLQTTVLLPHRLSGPTGRANKDRWKRPFLVVKSRVCNKCSLNLRHTFRSGSPHHVSSACLTIRSLCGKIETDMAKLVTYILLCNAMCLCATDPPDEANRWAEIPGYRLEATPGPKLSIILFTNRPGVYDMVLREQPLLVIICRCIVHQLNFPRETSISWSWYAQIA